MQYVKKKVRLSPDDREKIGKFIASGVKPARSVARANILLALDALEGQVPTERAIAETYHVSRQTVKNIKNEFHKNPDIDAVLSRKKRDTPPREIKITGDVEAHLIALCCSNPPEGYARWTVRLLADKMVELSFVPSISPMTVARVLKKTNISLT